MKIIRRFNSVSDMNTAVQTAPHMIVAVAYENGRIYAKIKRSNGPKNLVISCTENVVRISAIRATSILYRTDPNDAWTTYTEPFAISETVTVYAKAVNDYGEITGSQECVYVPLPSNLTISCTANTVTISATNATTIQYRTNPSGEWATYSTPFAINETVTVYAKASNAYGEITGSQECVYVAPPNNLVISCTSNMVTITADNATTIQYNTDGSSIYTTYTGPFAISETVTVYAKASNAGGEITGSQECVYVPLPSNLVISCTSNMVTITADNATTIQYRTNPSGEWTTYSAPFAITETVTVYAKASNSVGEITGSQLFTLPSNLIISCTANTVSISATDATTIQYRTNPSGSWVTYSAPFAITETVTVYAKASNSVGDITGSQECVYVAPPSNLTISCSANTVTITVDNATTIQYRTNPSGEWTTYTQPFAITETVTVYAKASNAGGEITGSQECVYVPIPRNLVISCSNNTVTITATNATTIEYNFDGSSTYTTYTQPFAITQTVTVYAKATNSYGSITGSQVCEYVNPIDYTIPFYIENTSSGSATVSIKKSNSKAQTVPIQKSSDGTTWETMGSTSTTALTTTVPVGGKLYLRGTSSSWGTSGHYNNITCNKAYKVGGNINSLLYGSSFNGQTKFPSVTVSYIFKYLFSGNTYLTDASELQLPATTLAQYCYQGMFQGCTSLTTAPTLPATTLTDYCYIQMFSGCTALTTAPALPATTLAMYCYSNMFRDCTSLTTAPALPATTLTNWCYQSMFYDCTALTTAPDLPATTLAENCYQNMFYSCTNLNYIKCLATDISATSCTHYWTWGVAATGTFVKDPNMSDWTTGASGIPSGWTVEDNTN